MEIPFAPGADVDAGEDRIASKDDLIARLGDVAVRTRVIAALSAPDA
jgi:hypothetical protein